jgi:phosphoenolpyruvate carboxylase
MTEIRRLPNFLNFNPGISKAKKISSLENLWLNMFEKQALVWWKTHGVDTPTVSPTAKLLRLLDAAKNSEFDEELRGQLLREIDNLSEDECFLITKAIHVQTHMRTIDYYATRVFKPAAQKKERGLLDHQLILTTFLQHLSDHGEENFADLFGTCTLRLVSTVHPNETERNTNLMHYNAVEEKYVEFMKDFDSLANLSSELREFRLRRERLNQLRRRIKAEVEGVWQSNQMRPTSITVQNEARRLVDRYRVIMEAYPMFVKMVKKLAKEAYWLYKASQHSKDEAWVSMYLRVEPEIRQRGLAEGRDLTLQSIRRTFKELGIAVNVPSLPNTLITFGTWKGGDRDGNPFVVGSFSNQSFVEHKQFVLETYIAKARVLLDSITPSTHNISSPVALNEELELEKKTFPYLDNVKFWEPYRAKLRYILEKLENTLDRVLEVKKRAGDTVKPLLSQTQPGPTGYSSAEQLERDVRAIYQGLMQGEGKSQARSLVQDLFILVSTFGLHLASIDFRQTSSKNEEAVLEYLKLLQHSQYAALVAAKNNEAAKRRILLALLIEPGLELFPWTLASLSKTSRDTFETFLIFADAARVDYRAVGKFIISMCQDVSDILNVLMFFKLCGMMRTDGDRIAECPFDVCGLFETIGDLQSSPRIISDLLNIPLLRDYIINLRNRKLTVMTGYSDSTRDGSALASDSQLADTAVRLKAVEAEFNSSQPDDKRISLIFYRGRGDTIPRGYGGSISEAIMSQEVTSHEEDHTEQNRYLRRYASTHSAIDHFHILYSAHLNTMVRRRVDKSDLYLKFFVFFGKLSYVKWCQLVRTENGGKGKEYFEILNNYSILSHLPKSNFASRPVAREGVNYDIDSIRAIPFTMCLAQLREFTTAYYGTGSAFQVGSALLETRQQTTQFLVKQFLDNASSDRVEQFYSECLDADSAKRSSLAQLVRTAYANECKEKATLVDLFFSCESAPYLHNEHFESALQTYPTLLEGIETVAQLMMYLLDSSASPLSVLQEMYQNYPPFIFSIRNKETSLFIRRKDMVDLYTGIASESHHRVLRQTEAEAALTQKWVLLISQQKALEQKTINVNFNTPQLRLLHVIQNRLLSQYRSLNLNQKGFVTDPTQRQIQKRLEECVQMTILAISEALGFGG